MKQMDLFSFFNGENMGAMEFTPLPTEEPKKKEQKKKETTSVANKANKIEDIEEVEDDENELLSMDLDTTDTPKKSSNQSTKKSTKKKGVTGKSMVSLPARCYGRNWNHTIEGFGEKSLNEILQELFRAGFIEVAHKEILPVSDEKALKAGLVYFKSPDKESSSNVSLFGNTTKAAFVDGMEQYPFEGLEEFKGLAQEEVSVLDGQMKFEESFPVYKNLGISYCSSSSIGVPILLNKLGKEQEVTLPITVNVAGRKFEVTREDFPMKEKVLGKDIEEEYYNGLPVTLKIAGNTIFGEFLGTAATGLTKPGQHGGKESTVKELFTLPCSCYFVTLNQTFSLTSEMFGGKEKVTKEELLDLLRKTYTILRNKDRRVEVVYARDQSLVSVALTSGTKGAYALPETECTGLFKLIRTASELEEVKKLSNFLGNYVPNKGPCQRVEVCPHGIFLSTMGEGKEMLQIKEVHFERKLPKIPRAIFLGILEDFKANPQTERILQVCWNSKKQEYFLSFPGYEQSGKGFIHYRFGLHGQDIYTVLTVHSHNTMPAYFSSIDNRDEAITGLYGVIGTVDQIPTYKFRVGVEGVFQELEYADLFEEV